jgi:CBS domain-containing protein
MELTEKVRQLLKQREGQQLHSLPPHASVYDAIALMAEKRIGSVLVMAEGELVGIVSERDYARKVILQGKSSRDTEIREIMSSPVITVTPNDTIAECMSIITERRVRHLPVLENSAVIGLVSIGDLVKRIISVQQETIGELRAYIAGGYPN